MLTPDDKLSKNIWSVWSTMEINGDVTMVATNDEQRVNIELLSKLTLKAEFRNWLPKKSDILSI